MENITLAFALEICGGVAVVIGAFAAIKKIFIPFINVNERVSKLEKNNDEMKEKIECVNCTTSLLCEGMIGLINNIITGNGVDNLKNIRDKMINHVTKN